MTSWELAAMILRWNQALAQYAVNEPEKALGRAKESFQLVLRMGGISTRNLALLNPTQHAEPIDAQLEADARALDRDIAEFTGKSSME